MKLLVKILMAFVILLNTQQAGAKLKIKPRTYYYVATDTINARAEEGFQGEILKTFKKGDRLMVLKVGRSVTIAGKTAPWCDIGYTLGNSERRGVVWSGYLAGKKACTK